MKKWLKIIIGLAAVGIVAAGLGYKFIYNKPHRNFEKAKVDFSITSKDLFLEYRSSKQLAEQKYNGKVIEISGLLDNVETPDSMTIAVFAIEEGMFGDEGIRCTMLPNHSKNLNTYVGSEIKIKGYCTGYNDTDVIFEKSSIVK